MDITDKELYKKCVELSFAIRKYRNEFIALLPEVNSRQLYLQHGMHSIYEFASKLACISNKTVDRILRTNDRIKNFPNLTKKFQNGEATWSKLEVIAKIVTPENEKELANKVETMSQASLELMVRDHRTQNVDSSVDGTFDTNEEPLESFPVKLHTETMNKLRVLKHKLEKENKQPLSWEETVQLMIDKLEEPQPKTRNIKPKTKITRHIPIAIQREALAKTNHMCSVANCKNPAEEFHHKIAFSKLRKHENIEPLCKPHHDIIHHAGDTETNRLYQKYKGQSLF